MFYIQLASLGGYFTPSKVSFGAILAVSGDKNILFQQIWHLHFKPSAPDFKKYIFGMLIQFLIDLQKRNCWFFSFGGSLGPVWLVHNLNLLNLDRLTKLPQLLFNVSNEVVSCPTR